MKNIKNLLICAFIAGATTSLNAETADGTPPNFELYNKFQMTDVAISINNVKKGNPGYYRAIPDAIPVKRGLGNQFKTTVDTSEKTVVKFWKKYGTTVGNTLLGEYEIKPTQHTIYLSIGKKDGRVQVYPQTGKAGKILGPLGFKSVIKTESGLDNSKNVEPNEITTKKAYTNPSLSKYE